MPVNGTNSLFIHIPKCGGTSLEVALGVADEYPNLGIEPTFTRPHLKSLFGGDMQHLTIREIRENFSYILKRGGLFSFSVVRDPVERFISHFLWKHYRFENPSVDELMIDLFMDEVRELIAVSRQFNAFQHPFDGMRWCEGDSQAIPISDLRRHLLPECSYIFDNGVVPIDSIYTLHSMKHLEATLKMRGSLSCPIPNRMVNSASHSLRMAISPGTKNMIRNVYRHDIRLNEIVRQVSEDNSTGFCPGSAISVRQFFIESRDRFEHFSSSTERSSRIPKRIWMYWHQGEENMGVMVRKCFESWKRHNTNWEIGLLTSKTINDFIRIPEFYDELNLPFAALSDVIRIHLLEKYGGVWADATTWCVRSLDEWLENALIPSGFFAYAKPAPDRPFSSWFLAAYPRHKIAKKLKDVANDMWRSVSENKSALGMEVSENPLSRDYFWFHKLFAMLIETDTEVGQIWDTVTKISADAPHYLQRVGLIAPTTREVESHIHNKITNVYKLDRRVEIPGEIRGTVLGSLYDTL